MSEFAIQVSNLTKVYQVWRKPSDMLAEALTGRRRHTEFCALKDVNFELPRGSVMGVLGRNGAGKSTLLRMVAGTLEATSGSVKTTGRIASILELGTGFHPDYSGRENVFLGGMCLGLDKKTINERFDEIVAFAELKDFIDRPFRTYSSGMQARLTFAVATSVDPDILIVDEALAVGDARFSLKSFDRMQEFRRRGKAILLVSHSINTVATFCDRAILLEKGELVASGQPAHVANVYHELLFGSQATERSGSLAAKASVSDEGATHDEQTTVATPATAELKLVIAEADNEEEADVIGTGAHSIRYGDYLVEIERFRIVDALGRRATQLNSLGHYKFQIRLRANEDAPDVCVGIVVRTPKGTQVYAANSLQRANPVVRDFKKGDVVDVYVPFDANLGHGQYFASALASRSDGLKHDAQFDVLEFAVQHTECHDESIANLNVTFEFPAEKEGARTQLRNATNKR